MKEIAENDILRFTRAIPVPQGRIWEVALLCEVREGETVSFRGKAWAAGSVSKGEFCGAPVYQVKLDRVMIF